MLLRALPAFLGLALLVTAAQAQEEQDQEEQTQEEQAEATADLSPAEERGRQVFLAASCAGCHTAPDEGTFLAGGRAISSPFGTFYSPNITPHPEAGLGNWSEAEFARALREGRMPGGSAYYPAFPYTSYTGMSDADVSDLWAYIQTIEPSDQANREHDLSFPFGFRFLLEPWRLLFFEEGRFEPDPALSEEEARGAYLVEVLGHCGECHTPRNRLGAQEQDRAFGGTATGPDGRRVANITPHEDGLADWSAGDIAYYLETGFTPEFDYAGGAMVEVIETSTSQLSDADRQAMAAYLKRLAPLPRE
ncbi:cytochrome c [Aquibaculum arenosum]|uniref:Cytochrome c n=1 Tax=Aquibaculum arenosum TaxID=3032591 RepID=A0ABT5YLM7_9PROT|nr:cytochrome c [Fodinicurvata sp. CAU 1616]MDF2095865.1 cytochrome c [Fodinicurvata sp. CAU 1616]